MIDGALPPEPEIVLVIDDEPFVLNAVCSILTHAGYTVLRASSSAEALALGQKWTETIHLCLSDVLLPGMSGPVLAERFTDLHPEAVWLFMAGLSDTREVTELIVGRGLPFLPKPFSPRTLLRKVEDVMYGGAKRRDDDNPARRDLF